MTLRRLVTQFTYRIEAKPGGGYIAHPSDPAASPLEADTREALQALIQARVAADLAKEFPGLKVPLGTPGRKFSFHVETRSGGGFTLHSADPSAPPIHGATNEELRSHVSAKLQTLAGQHGVPELAQIASPPRSNPLHGPEPEVTRGAPFDAISSAMGPPESSQTGTVVRVVLTLVVIAVLFYLFVYRR